MRSASAMFGSASCAKLKEVCMLLRCLDGHVVARLKRSYPGPHPSGIEHPFWVEALLHSLGQSGERWLLPRKNVNGCAHAGGCAHEKGVSPRRPHRARDYRCSGIVAGGKRHPDQTACPIEQESRARLLEHAGSKLGGPAGRNRQAPERGIRRPHRKRRRIAHGPPEALRSRRPYCAELAESPEQLLQQLLAMTN